MELVKYSKQVKDSDQYQLQECSICMDEFAAEEVLSRIPTCQHMFHSACITKWFNSKTQKKEQKCPLCNQVMDLTKLIKKV